MSSESKIFVLPLSVRALSVAGVVILAVVMVVEAALGMLIFRTSWLVGLLATLTAGFIAGLTVYCWRDMTGKLGLVVTIGKEGATFVLPKGRSLIHRPQAFAGTIPFSDMLAIESRFEGYETFGMAMMQRAYVLQTRSRGPIFLAEERALATGLGTSYCEPLVAELKARSGAPVRELGTVRAKGGVLGVWGAHAPDWATSPLPRESADRLWRHAAATGSLVMLLMLIVSGLMALS